ncbi:MAG TPA: Lrp/AsnC family transcriptional regulator [Burkholderiales bacterium]|nr:Lrp/AsnC family transcriptional regulator [Burkholderiales bacterium]
MKTSLYDLDRIDRRLLNLVQENNRLPTQALADRLRLSPPTCLRRLRDLHANKIICGDVALVDPFQLGYGLTAFLDVSLENQSEARMAEFEARVKRRPEVLQCFVVSGEADFFMIVHVADMEGYYTFVREAISGAGNVRNFKSRFPMKRVKYNTRIVFDEKADRISVRCA